MIIKGKSEQTGLQTIFTAKNQPNTTVTMGYITLLPGEHIPEHGFSRHDQDEYSYVIKGQAHTVLEDGQDIVGKEGDFQLIAAGEGHKNYNDSQEIAELIWILVDSTYTTEVKEGDHHEK